MDPAASEGAFRHLRALQDIASESGGNRAAGTLGYDRSELGTIEITVVSDGTLAFPAETLWGDRAKDARGLLTSAFQPASPVGLQLNTISSTISPPTASPTPVSAGLLLTRFLPIY